MTHWIRGWMGPSSCLDPVKKKKKLVVPVIRPRLAGCPGRSLVTTPAELPRLLFDDSGKYLCGLFCVIKKTTMSWSVRSPSQVLNSGHPIRDSCVNNSVEISLWATLTNTGKDKATKSYTGSRGTEVLNFNLGARRR